MKGQTRTGLKVMAVLFASAALTLAQVNPVSAPAAQGQYPTGPQQYPSASNGPAQYGAPAYGRPQMAQVGPGTINYVEGQASVNGQDLSQSAVGSVTVEPGGVIDTGNGYAEVLLTPGAFLRIGHNSEVRLVNAGLAGTRVQVVRGASEIEVDQLIQGSHIAVELNGSMSQIEKKGLYSFDAAQQSVRVLDGKATVTEGVNRVTLDKGHEVMAANGQVSKKRGFDEKQAKQEPLYVWSRIRSQDEAQLSYAAARNMGDYPALNNGWFWNPYMGFYGFWPADAYLYSPFGFGFYSPLYFGYGGYGFYGHGVYRGAYRGGFVGSIHGGGYHGFAGGGFHGGGFHGGGGGHR